MCFQYSCLPRVGLVIDIYRRALHFQSRLVQLTEWVALLALLLFSQASTGQAIRRTG